MNYEAYKDGFYLVNFSIIFISRDDNMLVYYMFFSTIVLMF